MLDLHEQFLLNAIELRQKARSIITSNIANAHTPGYQARRLDFESALSSRMIEQSYSLHHEKKVNSDAENIYTRESMSESNTVSMNEERADFSQNLIHENLLLSLLKHHYHQLQTAISGQV